MKGSQELQNGGLRALEEAWDDFLPEGLSCQVRSCSGYWGGSRRMRSRNALRVFLAVTWLTVYRQSQVGTTQKHRLRADLTGKCLKQKVVPGVFQSSQATVLKLWAFPDFQGPPETQLDTSWSHLETPQKQRNDQT